MKLKAVFLDKDGTLMPEIPNNSDLSRLDLNEGIVEGLQLLQSYGYLLVLVSNKSALAYGNSTPEQVDMEKNTINSMCSKVGIYLDGYYYCPHHPNGTVASYAAECDCHIPSPGLLLKAAGDMDIDLSSSWMIGDIFHDMEAGNRAGCKTVYVNNGTDKQWESHSGQIPQFQAKDLAEAARCILSE
jgi:D,D-heptose 1,7-bisphosphate phosphatase